MPVPKEATSGPYATAIDAGLATHAAGLNTLWETAKAIKNDPTLEPSTKDALLSRIYASLSMKDMTSTIKEDLTGYDIGVSFRSGMAHMQHVRHRLKRLGFKVARGQNPKLIDREFAQRLGVPTPRTIARNAYPQDLPVIPRTIIKPRDGAGASGVYRVNDDKSIQSFKTSTKYQSMSEALVEVQHKPIAKEPVWIVEELISREDGEPAHDVKAYMFYGQVGVVLEIARGRVSGGKNLYCYYGPSGEFLQSGDPQTPTFKGEGIPRDLVEKARVLSLATPVPFLRFDFHRGAEQCYLGEITPYPGGTSAGQFSEEFDKRLGRLFLDAEARLMADLLQGKSFETYFETYPDARKI